MLNVSDTRLGNVSPASLSCRQQNWFSAQPIAYPICLPSYVAVFPPLQRFPGASASAEQGMSPLAPPPHFIPATN